MAIERGEVGGRDLVGIHQGGDHNQLAGAKALLSDRHAQFAYGEKVWELLIGRDVEPGRALGFRLRDQMILASEPLAPPKMCFAGMVLAAHIGHAAGLEAGEHKVRTIEAVGQYDVAPAQLCPELAK